MHVMSKLIALGLTLAIVLVVVPLEAGAASRSSELATRLLAEPSAILRDLDGRPAAAFDFPLGEARIVLFAVTRERGLPDGYEPPDLTRAAGPPVRQIVLGDFRAMVDAAAADNVELAPVSTYRSPGEQAAAFESSVWRAIGRAGGAIDRAEAEARAARFVAPPGHSQHQLGTAIDFSSGEIGYAIQPQFDETAASRWLAARGWEFGFILPYPRDKEDRTGYAYEPWHWRWIGRPLAAALWRDGYLGHPVHVVDDYLRAVEEILNAEAAQ